MAPLFTFTRSPSTKVSVAVSPAGLVQADNELILIGQRASSGGTATNNVPKQITNFGDPVLALAEAEGYFGTGSQLSKMVVAAIKAVLFTDMNPKVFPPIKAICFAHSGDDTNLAALLAANIGLKMPFVAIDAPASDAASLGALRDHLTAISASDRGSNGQFGSFGFLSTNEALGDATPEGEDAASENICIAWLRDSGTANTTYNVAAAVAALCASNGLPFQPVNDLIVGGLATPVAVADWHTSGDTGSEALGLASGLIPLMSGTDGRVRISRSVTTRRTEDADPDNSYYDLQDWQTLYYIRKDAYTLAQQDRYKRAKATDKKLQALLSELIDHVSQMEALELVQHVKDLIKEFTVERDPTNRHAGIYYIPLNVVPGFHNKGIALNGTTEFDALAL